MATILERIQYGFDRDSRRMWRRRALATGEDYHYGYDGLSQVVTSDQGNLNLNCSAIAAVPGVAENWDYDPTGNWHGHKVETDGTVTLEQDRVHDKGNRLTRIQGEVRPFALDCVGRLTQAAPDASGDWEEPLKFKWDAWNRVTEIRRASDSTILAEYAYDGLGRRTIREMTGVVLHTYFSDRWKPLEERKDSGTTASMQYLWGSRHRDDLVRRDRDSDDGGTLDETRYVLMDYYSPAAMTDEEGTVSERYDFTAFGIRRILQPDFGPRATSESAFEFAFQGQFWDGESGLQNYGYRYYSPYLGRWLSKDPLTENDHYQYYWFVENNPSNAVDLYGLVSMLAAGCCDCPAPPSAYPGSLPGMGPATICTSTNLGTTVGPYPYTQTCIDKPGVAAALLRRTARIRCSSTDCDNDVEYQCTAFFRYPAGSALAGSSMHETIDPTDPYFGTLGSSLGTTSLSYEWKLLSTRVSRNCQ